MKTSKIAIVSAALAAILYLPMAATADAYCSSTTPAKTITYNDGRVTVLAPWRGDYIDVCNVNTTWKGVSTANCLVWFSQIANAYSAGKGMLFYYYGITQGECATMPLYTSAPAPGYISVE